MKAKYFLFLILAAGAFSLSSCQKDLSKEITATETPTNLLTDSNYLDKIYYININGSIRDTAFFITYDYDNLKRVVHTAEGEMQNNVFIAENSKNFFYNGTDTVAYKSLNIDVNQSGIPNDTTTCFYYYNTTGQRIKDSSLFIRHSDMFGNGVIVRQIVKDIRTYQYVVGKIYGNTVSSLIYDNSPTPVFYTGIIKDTATLDAAGNILQNKNTDLLNNTETQSVFTYDTRKNPFYRLSNYSTINIFPKDETFIEEMQAKNNRLHAVQFRNGQPLFDEDYTGRYQYKLNGYPKQIDDNPAGDYLVSFVYKTL